jgi:diguanylate cyclase (GGDEF)-like protein
MTEMVPETLTVLPNPALFRAARWMQRIGLGGAAIGIGFGLLPLTGLTGNGATTVIARGAIPLLAAALFCTLSLLLSSPERTGVAVSYARRTANVLVLFAAAVVVFWSRATVAGAWSGNIVFPPERIAYGFAALALAVLLVDRKKWLLNLAADVLVCGLCLLSLLLISDSIFGRLGQFGGAGGPQIRISDVVCLVTLTVVVALRQTEHGVFSIFLGVGVGSRLARIFAPILVVLPFAWQLADTRLKGHLNAAALASGGVAAAVGILLFFTWRISRMENEIHELVLRDEETRLYNQRGFHMLAEHALRLAKRSGIPFSVLFIDFENLAQIHAQLGPNAAAASLAEAGEILRATFRESDIKGRIGADEFAVAGQFDRAGISVAALRLEAATAARSAKSGRQIPLRISMGHVTTTDPQAQETLKDLLVRAGNAKNRLDLQLSEMRVN